MRYERGLCLLIISRWCGDMFLWCKCGAFMGLREPLDDWTVERTGICPDCAREALGATLAKKVHPSAQPTADKPTAPPITDN